MKLWYALLLIRIVVLTTTIWLFISAAFSNSAMAKVLMVVLFIYELLVTQRDFRDYDTARAAKEAEHDHAEPE